MPDTLEEKQRKRFQFLNALYVSTDGSTATPVDLTKFGDELGFSAQDIESIYRYLKAENLIQAVAGGVIAISHTGIKEVEQAISQPDKETQHFPINIIHNFGTIGAIQQDVQNSTQTVYLNQHQVQSLSEFVEKLKTELPELNLTGEAKADVETQIAMLDIQERDGKPNRNIVGECLKSVRNVLEGFTGNMIAAGLLGQLHPLLHTLGIH